jgi:hypothetical protein
MSIPLDRLYPYIEQVAQEARNGVVDLHRFYPYGSKDISNLSPIQSIQGYQKYISPMIFCNDQEPLDFDCYQDVSDINIIERNKSLYKKHNIKKHNFQFTRTNIYDKSLLVHSEKRSANLEKYRDNEFIPVYYWSHAIIALDWFRYAQHQRQHKASNSKSFLIYNRAWSGTREYRLKFADLLIEHKLVDQCCTSVSLFDNNIYYQDHIFKNLQWQPTHKLEDFFSENLTTSCYSADFNLTDYNNTDIEIVLETLFDDDRLHLTEKILRPIACGQPFILISTPGSLEYLKSYGFKTFEGIIDETYDTVQDPEERLITAVHAMKTIVGWTKEQRQTNLDQLRRIAEYNRQHFFSSNFFQTITTELRHNLSMAFDTVTNTNTCQRWFDLRKNLAKDFEMKQYLTTGNQQRSRQDIAKIIAIASQYKNKSNK